MSLRSFCGRLGGEEWWSGGVVEWWSGGVVEWWSGGVVEWWSGGVVQAAGLRGLGLGDRAGRATVGDEEECRRVRQNAGLG
jgi:hypothetical protein